LRLANKTVDASGQAFQAFHVQFVSAAEMVQDFRLWRSGHRISLIMGELDVTGDRTVFVFTRDCSYIHIYRI